MGGLETLGELSHQGSGLVRPVVQPSPGLGGLKGAEVGFQIKGPIQISVQADLRASFCSPPTQVFFPL